MAIGVQKFQKEGRPRQSVFERLVGIGTIAVSTAAGEGEVVLRGIPGAAAVKEQIRAVRLEKTGKPETPGE